MDIRAANSRIERIDLAEEPDFSLGGMAIMPAERAVIVGGMRREMQPRVLKVLIALAQARPAVVSRQRLAEQCWDGLVVGDDALNRCIMTLRHLAAEKTPPPFVIETVARVGHRLTEVGTNDLSRVAGPIRAKRWLIAAPLIMLTAAAGLVALYERRTDPAPTSIAVLPFRNLSNGDPYFAEGVGEEILGQLAREPQFRVAGRASSARFTGTSDPNLVRQALGVDYILEGSVRSGNGRVRIDASLVKTSDGMRLWSETYDRKLDDILDIQRAIGEAVATGLRRQLVHAPTSVPRPINGQAYVLYLNAKGLLRSQNPQSGQDAVALLQTVVRLDPGYAAAWASLAEAQLLDGRTKGTEGLIAAVEQASRSARRALQLDPQLPQAHHVLGDLLGRDSREAIAHLRLAAALAPPTAEGSLWRGTALEVSGEYAAGLASYRRAHEIDPLWPTPVRVLVDSLSYMGERPQAEAFVRSSYPDDRLALHFALARIAWWFGDFSEAARHWAIVARDPASRWSGPSKRSLQDALVTLNLAAPQPGKPMPFIGQTLVFPRLWLATAPSPEAWRTTNRSAAAALVNHDENRIAAKLMINAGRTAELAATYDSPTGLLGVKPGQAIGVCQVDEAIIVALVLRKQGRDGEATALLGQADALLRGLYRRGTVPSWVNGDAAGLWAVQGKTGPAMAALERALARGVAHASRADLPQLTDEPAFAALHGNPRFEAIQAKYIAHFAKERKEVLALHL